MESGQGAGTQGAWKGVESFGTPPTDTQKLCPPELLPSEEIIQLMSPGGARAKEANEVTLNVSWFSVCLLCYLIS